MAKVTDLMSTGVPAQTAALIGEDANGVIKTQSATTFIGPDTVDGADSKRLYLSGGGANSGFASQFNRGSYLILEGNENAGAGRASLGAAGASINFDVNGTTMWKMDTTTGNLAGQVAGVGVRIKEGSNARMGTLTLTGTTPVVVSNTTITASTRIFLTNNASAGTPGVFYVSARSAGTSFSVTGSAGDTSTLAYLLVEPTP